MQSCQLIQLLIQIFYRNANLTGNARITEKGACNSLLRRRYQHHAWRCRAMLGDAAPC